MAAEDLQVGEAIYKVIRLARYDRDLRRLQRLERRLHAEVRKSLGQELEANDEEDKRTRGPRPG